MEKKLRLLWWGILGVLLVLAVVKLFLPVNSPVEVNQAEENREIVVYISGAVVHPGLLRLPLNARLDDALQAAELTGEADLEVLNPAQKLKDGQKIIVASKSTGTGQLTGNEVQNKTQNKTENSVAQSAGTTDGLSTKVNINTAGINELDTIPGIGPALAQRIIDYRTENGWFSAPEEIQNVSGIGSKTYEKMEKYISVGP
ncbi:MAG: helix-hairpin-helix domain-containing protein [Dehalobacter sp. 4CP]|uniref:helix-hairpin-helix domain-containing protein n=1 Tax=Dehalobacter sp. CP TaxID=2594474 RepID=UPI0013C97D0D|nr:helix-hairpin-helix domain-containing protein [Dehalobacter sp.]NBJ16812.1 helix-hairpin-helix domain-containing protein [Dehalobacter sp. 4CP]